MKSVFITGTDTEVGKTIVTGLLAGWLVKSGYKVTTQKWVETGCLGRSRDVSRHCKLIGLDYNSLKYSDKVSPYRFKLAASPHLAAETEGADLCESKIVSSFNFLKKKFDTVLVEGAGGALVPFTRHLLGLDLAASLDLPVLVVVANKLGAINHALLTVEAVRARKMPLLGLVFNNICPETAPIILKDNPKIISCFQPVDVLGSLPYCRSKKTLIKEFDKIAGNILKRIA